MLEDLAADVPDARRPPVIARLEVLDREIHRTFADPAWVAEARIADRQGLGSARLEPQH